MAPILKRSARGILIDDEADDTSSISNGTAGMTLRFTYNDGSSTRQRARDPRTHQGLTLLKHALSPGTRHPRGDAASGGTCSPTVSR
jgi:hypothetical protein